MLTRVKAFIFEQLNDCGNCNPEATAGCSNGSLYEDDIEIKLEFVETLGSVDRKSVV